MSRNKPTGSEGKGESVAERAVRAYMCGHVNGTRKIESAHWQNVTRPKLDGTGDWEPGLYATLAVFIPQKSIDTMLRRERAHAREKARAKSDPGGYIGEALSSIGDQKRAAKKPTNRKGTRNG